MKTVLILADDLGWSDVGYHGGAVETPHLDAMAAAPHSAVLERFYSASAVCSPTRASFMTGRNPNRYCMWNANSKNGARKTDIDIPSLWPLPPDQPSVARLLSRRGVHTAVFGKWHLGDLQATSGGSRRFPVVTPREIGFDEWNVTMRSAPTYHLNCGCTKTAECRRGPFPESFDCSNYYHAGPRELEPYDRLITDDNKLIGDLAERYLRARAADGRAFFLYLPFHTVHEDYIGNPEWTQHYLAQGYGLEQAHYYAAISGMDEQVGRLRRLIDALDLDVMLWFSSDNGPSQRAPANFTAFRGAKGTLWEGGIRVPTIVEWSEISANRRESQPLLSSDFLPTLGELADFESKGDGRSALAVLRGETVSVRGFGFAFDLEQRWLGGLWQLAWQRGDWKLVEERRSTCTHDCVDRVQRSWLFNLVDDPLEQLDLSRQHPATTVLMQRELHSWFADVQLSIRENDCPLPNSSALLSLLLLFFVLL